MSHENAPATKLLATACACCGRALVDAVSVETGIGPECRARFFVESPVDDAARDAANLLVHEVARKGCSKARVREVCARLRELGLPTLADRILKRFRMTAPPPVNEIELARLRAEYARVRAFFCYDSCTPERFDGMIAGQLGDAAGPADFVAAAKVAVICCTACNGSGRYGNGGARCFRCAGKGKQTADDVRRNRMYDDRARGLNRRAG